MNRFRFKIVFFICSIMLFSPFSINNILGKDFIVVIDPGHGGNDPGAIGKIGKEKDINLKVALRLGELISTNSPNTKVIYTRSKDIFLPLDRRAEIANNAKADLFISIHTNAVAKNVHNIRGTETYTLGLHRSDENFEVAKRENSVILVENDYKQRYAGFNPNSAESYIMFEFLQDKNMESSVKFAKSIQSSFKNHVGRADRGVHQAGFLVLRGTSMPSVLVELGYISNPTEEKYLISNEGTNSLARGIYKAFTNYRRSIDNKAKSIINDDNDELYLVNSTKDSYSFKDDNITKKDSDISVNSVQTPAPINIKKDIDKEKTNNLQVKPVFKIQIAASEKLLKGNDKFFKGLTPIDYYKEKGIYKYTYKSNTDYNEILKINREVRKLFKDAFIIAFKNGEKIDVNKAIQEFNEKR